MPLSLPARPRARIVPLVGLTCATGVLAAAAIGPVAADPAAPAFATSTLTTAPGDGPTAVVAADLDGDGDLDVATANYASQDVTILTRQADGGYASEVAGSVARPGALPAGFLLALTAADVDGDGDLDLVVPVPADRMVSRQSGYVAVLTRAEDGTYASSTLSVAGDNNYDPYDLVAADLDGDGDLDLATANFSAGTITTFTRGPDGSYSTLTFPVADYGTNPAALVVADLDGDGVVELAVANDWPGNVAVLDRGPGGAYTSTIAADLGDGSRPRSIVAADLDGDGDLDLATGNYGSRNVSVLTRGSEGGYSAAVAGTTGDVWPIDLQVADLDGDGDPDLTTLNGGYDGYGDLTVLTRGADGSYTPSNPGAVNRPTTLAVADLDGDGDGDLAVPDVTADTVTVFTNTASAAVRVPVPTLTNATGADRGTAAPAVGDTVGATLGATSPTEAAVTYQWSRSTPADSFSPIPAATGSSYTLAPDDLGATVQLTVTGSAGSYATGRAVAHTGVVVEGTLPDPEVTLTGNAEVGRPLHAASALALLPEVAVTWQWQTLAHGYPTDIPGATSATFRPTAAHAGRVLRVVASVTSPGYEAAAVHADSAVVAKGRLTRPRVKLSGAAVHGKTLSASVGHTGTHPSGYRIRYQWKVGTKLTVVHRRTFKLGRSTVGRRITVTTTSTAPGYRAVVVTSKPSAVVQ